MTDASNVREILNYRRKPNHSYFVVMIDHGRLGLEANVDPEITRRGVVSRLKSGEYQHVEFIHYVADGLVEDVTADLIDEAELELKEEYRATKHESFLKKIDHVRDLRKHEAV
jgi:hypothetical protein